jgi:hypothetical protein
MTKLPGAERALVVLTTSLPDLGLEVGDVGVVVHVHGRGDAFEVEFLTLEGETAAVATLSRSQVRPVRKGEIAQARTRVAA